MPDDLSLWARLCGLPSLKQTRVEWQQRLGLLFPVARSFLLPVDDEPLSILCRAPCGQGCRMRLRPRDDDYVAFCVEDPPEADSQIVAKADAAMFHLDAERVRSKLAAALDIALAKDGNTGLRRTWLIGTVHLPPGREVNVYFSFAQAANESVPALALRGCKTIIMLVPGTASVNEATRTIADASGGFIISLESLALLQPDGSFRAERPLATILSAATNRFPDPEYQFSRHSDRWHIRFAGGKIEHLNHTKGCSYILLLLENPYTSFSALELQQLADRVADVPKPGAAIEVTGDFDLQQYRTAISELQAELDLATRDNDAAARERLKREMDALVQEAKKAFNIHGEQRTGADTMERARKSVSAAIHTTLRKIEGRHREMGAFLSNAISPGEFLRYHPSFEVKWNL